MSYSEKLKNPNWQKKRLEIFKRDKWKCKLCSDKETTLNIHHIEYIKGNEPWEHDNTLLVTLCKHCHFEVEKLKKQGLGFYNIKIYKSCKWDDNSRLMFVSVKEIFDSILKLNIYDKNDNHLTGYNFNKKTSQEIKILITKHLK